MDPMTYVPPLRAAVLWCVGLQRGAFRVDTIAVVANVEFTRAKAFVSILLARGALTETDAGLMPSERWAEWSLMTTRARPQCSQATESSKMDAMRRAMAKNILAATAEQGWTLLELARRSGVAHTYLYRLRQRSEPLPSVALVLVARALGRSVEELVELPAQLGSLALR